MLGAINIVAFVPTRDPEKARPFYEGLLGLRFIKDDGFALVLDPNGDHGQGRESSGIQAGTVHDSGMASYRH